MVEANVDVIAQLQELVATLSKRIAALESTVTTLQLERMGQKQATTAEKTAPQQGSYWTAYYSCADTRMLDWLYEMMVHLKHSELWATLGGRPVTIRKGTYPQKPDWSSIRLDYAPALPRANHIALCSLMKKALHAVMSPQYAGTVHT